MVEKRWWSWLLVGMLVGQPLMLRPAVAAERTTTIPERVLTSLDDLESAGMLIERAGVGRLTPLRSFEPPLAICGAPSGPPTAERHTRICPLAFGRLVPPVYWSLHRQRCLLVV